MTAPSAPTLVAQHDLTSMPEAAGDDTGTWWLACAMGDDFLIVGGQRATFGGTGLAWALISGTDGTKIGSGTESLAYVDWGKTNNGVGGNSQYLDNNLLSMDATHAALFVAQDAGGGALDIGVYVITRSGSSVSFDAGTSIATSQNGSSNGGYLRAVKTSANGATAVWMHNSDYVTATFTFAAGVITQTHSNGFAHHSDEEFEEVPHHLDQYAGLPDGSSVLYSSSKMYVISSSGGLSGTVAPPSGSATTEIVGTGVGRVFLRRATNYRRAYTGDMTSYDSVDVINPDDIDTAPGSKNSSIFDGTNIFEAACSGGVTHVRETAVASTGAPQPGAQLDTNTDANPDQVTGLASTGSKVLAVGGPSSDDTVQVMLYSITAPVENIDTGPLNNARIRFAG